MLELHLFLISALGGRGWSNLRPGRFTTGERTPVPIEQEAGWPPKQVQTFWQTEKSLGPLGNRKAGLQAHGVNSILTAISRLLAYVLQIRICVMGETVYRS